MKFILFREGTVFDPDRPTKILKWSLSGDWWWRLVSGRRVVGGPEEGYKTQRDMVSVMTSIFRDSFTRKNEIAAAIGAARSADMKERARRKEGATHES